MASFFPGLGAWVVHSVLGEVPRSSSKPHMVGSYFRDLLCNVCDDRVENRFHVWQRKVCAEVG